MPLDWSLAGGGLDGLDEPLDVLLAGCARDGDGLALAPGVPLPAAELEAIGARLARSGFAADANDVRVVVPPSDAVAGLLVVVGLGDAAEVDATVIRRAAGNAARAGGEARTIGLALVGADAPQAEHEAALEGALLGRYEIPTLRSAPAQRVGGTIASAAPPVARARAAATAHAVALARDLSNRPPSLLPPEALAAEAEALARATGLACAVLDEGALAERGFGALLSVARGASVPPRLIELRYAPPTPAATRVVLVGKGVTYDSGGINLKTDPAELLRMKTDMAGGAAVIAAMGALGALGVPCEVVGLVPASENVMGPAAYKPGDVVTHFGGVTSEVFNTDSEGRLLLADALAYASTLKPDAIVDIATLTGSMSLGPRAAGLLCNDDVLQAALLDAAAVAGEPTWPMPLFDFYRPTLRSAIADIKNQGYADGAGHLITSSLFLEHFVAAGIPWAHFEIAGPARAAEPYDEVSAGGTGAGVRTLLRFLEAVR